jgi:hypothetical protein
MNVLLLGQLVPINRDRRGYWKEAIAILPKTTSFSTNQSCNDVDTHGHNRRVEEKG